MSRITLFLLLYLCVNDYCAQYFGPSTEITSSTAGPSQLFASDINGDGILEVLTYSEDDDKLSYFVKDGTDGFESQQLINPFLSNLKDIEMQDVDDDGDQDFVMTSFSNNTIQWLENLGDFTFIQAESIDIQSFGVHSLVIADLDGDSDKDIVSTVQLEDQITWFPNNSGIFGNGITMSLDIQAPCEILGGQFMGTNENQFMIRSAATNGIYLCTYSISTGFEIINSIFFSSGEFFLMEKEDIDADGTDELFISSQSGLTYFSFDSNGNYSSTQIHELSGSHGLYITDNEPGGMKEIFFTQTEEGIVGVMKNPTGYSWEYEIIRDSLDLPTKLVVVDVENDGFNDLIWLNRGSEEIIMMNGGANGFGGDISISETLNAPVTLALSDLTGNGLPDIVSSAQAGGKIVCYHNNGQLMFGEQNLIYDDARAIADLVQLDISNDGIMDLITVDMLDDKIRSHISNQGLDFMTNDLSTDQNGVNRIRSGDLNSDGLEDLVIGKGSAGEVAVLLRQDQTSFAPVQVIQNNVYGVFDMEVADLDGINGSDLVYISNLDSSVYVNLNIGNGQFDEMQAIVTGIPGILSIEVADLDQDDDLDIIFSGIDQGDLLWARQISPMEFVIQPPINLGMPYHTIEAADINEDGYTDVIGVSHSNNRVDWYQNEQGALFTYQENLVHPDANAPINVKCVDMDNDDDPDLIVTYMGSDMITYNENFSNIINSVEESEIESFQIYPNPATNQLTITSHLAMPMTELTVIDMNGRNVSQMDIVNSNNSIELHVKELPAGAYTLRIKSGEKDYHQNFIKLATNR